MYSSQKFLIISSSRFCVIDSFYKVVPGFNHSDILCKIFVISSHKQFATFNTYL